MCAGMHACHNVESLYTTSSYNGEASGQTLEAYLSAYVETETQKDEGNAKAHIVPILEPQVPEDCKCCDPQAVSDMPIFWL